MAEVEVSAQHPSRIVLEVDLVLSAAVSSIVHQCEVFHFPVPEVSAHNVPLQVELLSHPIATEDASSPLAIELLPLI